MAVNDWAEFTNDVSWFVKQNAAVEVSAPRKSRSLTATAAAKFPELNTLLSQALVTDVIVDRGHYELFAWNSTEGYRLGWLCLPPSRNVSPNLHEDHRTLLASFGGIVERFNEPSGTWLLNMNDALTEREASREVIFLQDYSWAFDDVGLTLPIEPDKYYSIVCEANGNTTLCHRLTGQLLMFAPDHCFKHITKLAGCPDYTLYTINGAETFRDWVSTVSSQWLSQVGQAPVA